MSWAFSDNAKKVRRSVYSHFLTQGRNENTAAIMAETGLSLDQVKDALLELERGLMVMLQPGTFDVVKCPPWTNTPCRHVVETDGRFRAFAGCSVEAINMSYCYPGETVTIRSSCPQTGEEITLTFKDGRLLDHTPRTLVMHFGIDPRKWQGDWFRACEHNNFFASPQTVAAWERARPEYTGAQITVEQFLRLARYNNRLDLDRGADVNPAVMLEFLKEIGVQVPAAWTKAA
jgi:hypothetical protein